MRPNYMKHKKLIIILLLFFAIIVFGTFLYTHYFPNKQQVPFIPQPEETNESTFCNTHDNCWCRSFNGAEFIPGEKVPHRCNLEAKKCLPCYYE